MDAKRFAVLAWLMALLAFTNTGCFTIMGAAIGNGVDAVKPDQFRTDPGWQVATLKPGTLVSLSLQDSSRLNGIFTGVEQQSAEVYAHRYAAWQAQPEGAALPRLGDRITLNDSYGRRRAYEFQGFDYRRVGSSPRLRILVKQAGRPKLEAVDLDQSSHVVDSQGTAQKTGDLTRRFLDGRLPLWSEVMITQVDTVRVAVGQVASMARLGMKQRQPIEEITGVWVENLKRGTPITLSLRDSSRLNGIYFAVEEPSTEAYAQWYAAWQAQPVGASLPRSGDRIMLTDSYGKRLTYEFQGFDYRQGQFSSRPRLRILVRQANRPELKSVNIDQSSQVVDRHGRGLTTDALNKRFLEGWLSLWSKYIVTITIPQNSRTVVAIDQVASVTSPVIGKGAIRGAKMGAALDESIILAVVIGYLAIHGSIWLLYHGL